jgi:hypothetical protein
MDGSGQVCGDHLASFRNEEGENDLLCNFNWYLSLDGKSRSISVPMSNIAQSEGRTHDAAQSFHLKRFEACLVHCPHGSNTCPVFGSLWE